MGWRILIHPRLPRVAAVVAAIPALYGLTAYVVLPGAWTHYERQPALAGRPMVTRTAQGIPGDPLNVGLIGSRADILRAMHAAKWFPADPVTLRSSLEIIGSVLLDRPYRDAPVSALYYDGRREDLAFEKPAGSSADRRHHVRLWRVLAAGAEGAPVWLGAVTFDRGVGLSRYTGQVTHHIAPDIDAERDGFAADLMEAAMVQALYEVSGVGPTLNGRNGEGDRYWTDGEIWVMWLAPDGRPETVPPAVLPSPPATRVKNTLWRSIARALGAHG